jgi:hypothetical protein
MANTFSTIMARAWEIFTETYRYPQAPFRSIGRRCFAWALRRAWEEHRFALALASTPAETLVAQTASIDRELAGLSYRSLNLHLIREQDRLRAQREPLAAELARRAETPLALAA